MKNPCYRVMAQDNWPEIHSLEDNPGVLPEYLGLAHNVKYFWKFAYVIDLHQLVNKMKTISTQEHEIRTEYGGITYQNDSSILKLKCQEAEYKKNATLEVLETIIAKPRNRRAIETLGSIIKLITGNLDAEDAKKYDETINKLSSVQNQLKINMEKQTSLVASAFTELEHRIENLELRQERLKKAIEIKENVYGLYDQIIAQYDIIYHIAISIQTAITFAIQQIYHPSIINPKNIREEIRKIKDSGISLVPEYDLTNIIILQKLTKIQCYISNGQLKFIILFPILYEETFNYIHFTPIILNKDNYSYTLPVDTSYLLYNENNCGLEVSPCQEITNRNYLCRVTNLEGCENNKNCLIALVKKGSQGGNCNIKANPSVKKIINIDKNTYVTNFQDNINIIRKCKGRLSNINLKGNYLLMLQKNCEYKIDKTIYRSFEFKNNNYILDLPKFQIPKLEPSHEKINNEILKSTLAVNQTISDLKDLEEKIHEIPEKEIIHGTFGLNWILIVILLITSLYLVYKYYQYVKTKDNQTVSNKN